MHPNGRHRPIVNRPSAKPRWHPSPSVNRRENPTAIVIRKPAPRSRAEETPANRRVHVPGAVVERTPSKSHTKRSPAIAIAIATHAEPRPVGVQIRKTRTVVRCADILTRVVRRGRNAVNPPRNPFVEVVHFRGTADHQVVRLGHMHGKRLPL